MNREEIEAQIERELEINTQHAKAFLEAAREKFIAHEIQSVKNCQQIQALCAMSIAHSQSVIMLQNAVFMMGRRTPRDSHD